MKLAGVAPMDHARRIFLADLLRGRFLADERHVLLRRLDVRAEEVILNPGTAEREAWAIVDFFAARDRFEELWDALKRERPAAFQSSEPARDAKAASGSVPTWLVGTWHGAWIWRDKPRQAELFIEDRASCRMVVRYVTRGASSTVEQTLLIVMADDVVRLEGVGYRFLERGKATGWHLDIFELRADASHGRLSGVKLDKRGVRVDVAFERVELEPHRLSR